MIAAIVTWIGRMWSRPEPRRRLQLKGFGHAIPCPIHRGCIALSTGQHIRQRRERFAGLEH